MRTAAVVLVVLLALTAPASPAAPADTDLSSALAARFDAGKDLEKTRKYLARVGKIFDLATSRKVHQDVSLHEPVLREAAATIRRDALAGTFGLLDVRLPAREKVHPGRTLDAILDHVEAELGRAEEDRRKAFAKLSAEERTHVLAQAPKLLDAMEKHIYLDLSPASLAGNVRLLQIAKKVDYAALARCALRVAATVSPGVLDALEKAVEADDKLDPQARTVAERETPHGKLVVAGRGDDRHRGTRIKGRKRVPETKIAWLVDLGGDDVYTRSAGGARDGLSVFADLGGDDVYDTWEDFTQACGLLGVGILVDRAGNDTYTADEAAQGAGFFGAGLLIDMAGDDRYRALKHSQGFAAWGVGALCDRAGNDRYQALEFAQATAFSHAVAVLDDRAGDDDYLVKGPRPTNYGDGGLVDSFGQGSALGFRKPTGQIYAPGGIALFLDGGGRDRLEAGHFSQGAGYVFGWGACLSEGDDPDHYVGSRYNLGAAAHQAVGTFIDGGGDDRYLTLQSVICGASIDTSCVLFRDMGGDDVYDAGGTSLGAAQFGSVCLFMDDGGKDEYRRCHPAVSAHEENGPNWAVFLDAGGDEDVYRRSGKNDAVWHHRKHSFFLDLPAGTKPPLTPGALGKLVTDPPE